MLVTRYYKLSPILEECESRFSDPTLFHNSDPDPERSHLDVSEVSVQLSPRHRQLGVRVPDLKRGKFRIDHVPNQYRKVFIQNFHF